MMMTVAFRLWRTWFTWRLRSLERRIGSGNFDPTLSRKIDRLVAILDTPGVRV